jgi:hypothetical protein
MAPYDFDLEKRRIEEYETRTDSIECKAPSELGEKREIEGWALNVGLSSDQIWRLKETYISDKLESGTQELVTHYPLPGRDEKGKRFQKEFEDDQKR